MTGGQRADDKIGWIQKNFQVVSFVLWLIFIGSYSYFKLNKIENEQCQTIAKLDKNIEFDFGQQNQLMELQTQFKNIQLGLDRIEKKVDKIR